MKYFKRFFAYSYYFSKLVTPNRFSSLYESRAIDFFASIQIIYPYFIFYYYLLLNKINFTIVAVVYILLVYLYSWFLEKKYGENIEEIKEIKISIIEKVFSIVIHLSPFVILFIIIMYKPTA